MDFTQSFLQGAQAGQQRAAQQRKQEQDEAEFDLKKKMLKHQMDDLEIRRKIEERKTQAGVRQNAFQEAEMKSKFDAPAQMQGSGMITPSGGPVPMVDLKAIKPASVPVQIPEGGYGEPAETVMAPTLTGMQQREDAKSASTQAAIEARSKVFVPGEGFIDREIFTARQQEARDAARAAELDARLDRTDANVDKRIASQEKLARERMENDGGITPGDENVSFLLTGGTSDKLPIGIRSKAFAAAKAAGGIDGTGFVPTSGPQQNKFSFLYGDVLSKALRLRQFLENPEIAKKVGPFMGRVIDGTKEWSYVGQDTATKEAFDLFKDLSDVELRKRSGAAVSPNEYERIVGFTVDPTKQIDSNKTNLNRMIGSITRELKTLGADRIEAPTSKSTGRFKVEVIQ